MSRHAKTEEIEQRRSDAANAQEFHQIQQFVAECRRHWPGAIIVLRPDGASVGTDTLTTKQQEKTP